VIYQKEKVNYMSNNHEGGGRIEVDWAQILFNNIAMSWIDGPRCMKKCK
jgi:hypothetical protein